MNPENTTTETKQPTNDPATGKICGAARCSAPNRFPVLEVTEQTPESHAWGLLLKEMLPCTMREYAQAIDAQNKHFPRVGSMDYLSQLSEAGMLKGEGKDCMMTPVEGTPLANLCKPNTPAQSTGLNNQK